MKMPTFNKLMLTGLAVVISLSMVRIVSRTELGSKHVLEEIRDDEDPGKVKELPYDLKDIRVTVASHSIVTELVAGNTRGMQTSRLRFFAFFTNGAFIEVDTMTELASLSVGGTFKIKVLKKKNKQDAMRLVKILEKYL